MAPKQSANVSGNVRPRLPAPGQKAGRPHFNHARRRRQALGSDQRRLSSQRRAFCRARCGPGWPATRRRRCPGLTLRTGRDLVAAAGVGRSDVPHLVYGSVRTPPPVRAAAGRNRAIRQPHLQQAALPGCLTTPDRAQNPAILSPGNERVPYYLISPSAFRYQPRTPLAARYSSANGGPELSTS